MTAFLDNYPHLLPLIIFFGRICDVSLGTLRIIFVSKGHKNVAPLIGFVELFIWVVIIAQVLSRANDLSSYIAYAGGYSVGTFIGMSIEERLAFGFIKYRAFTMRNGLELVNLLNKEGFGSTLIHGEGSVSDIDIIETVIRRQHAKKVECIISEFDPKAFTIIEDIRAKQLGIFAKRQSLMTRK